MNDAYKLQKTVNWFCVIAWMIFIFAFSGQTAADSSALSGGIVDIVAKWLHSFFVWCGNGDRGIDLKILTFLIRKAAHAFLYFVLAVLVCRALSPSHDISKRELLIAFGITLLYACSDEIHQLFLDGRSAEIRDVIIDGCGAILGLAVYIFSVRQIKKRSK